MVSDFETEGGAAVSASRLAAVLARRGHTVSRAVAYADGHAHRWSTVTIDSAFRPAALTRRVGARLLRKRALPKPPSTRDLVRRAREILDAARPDVVNFHNVHGALRGGWSLDLLRSFARDCTVIWTLHDMWSFTGRCAYSGDCEAFIKGCDHRCPTPGQYPALSSDLIGGAWEQRRQFLSEFPGMTASSPSRWLADEAGRGLWRHHRIAHIPYGVPLDVYRPTQRRAARQVLGLPPDGFVIAMSAAQLDSPHKGLDIAKAALESWSGDRLTVMTMGSGRLDVASPAVDVRPLGSVTDERLRAIGYGAADFLLHPATNDNLPNVVLEALACGTPVVAFAVGGIPEMVRPGLTGWLAQPTDASSLRITLAEALAQIRDGDDRSLQCRATAESEYGEDLSADRYEALFDTLG
jgi:glycosyltransferase involved in cell wall biosynthesis